MVIFPIFVCSFRIRVIRDLRLAITVETLKRVALALFLIGFSFWAALLFDCLCLLGHIPLSLLWDILLGSLILSLGLLTVILRNRCWNKPGYLSAHEIVQHHLSNTVDVRLATFQQTATLPRKHLQKLNVVVVPVAQAICPSHVVFLHSAQHTGYVLFWMLYVLDSDHSSQQ